MFKLGLCSVTFRQLTPDAIINLAVQAGLKGIEWGGDIHVPPSNSQWAAAIGKRTRQAGLNVVSYGSYYRSGVDDNFPEVLNCAVELGAPAIRIWAGNQGSAAADKEARKRIVNDMQLVADQAAEHQLLIHIEYHRDTLTDTRESAAKLIEEVDHPAVHLYWQPEEGKTAEERLASIRTIKPYISNLHVFHWTAEGRLPLAAGSHEWERYLTEMAGASSRYLLMEFVKEDDPQQFLQDAEVLKRIISATCS